MLSEFVSMSRPVSAFHEVDGAWLQFDIHRVEGGDHAFRLFVIDASGHGFASFDGATPDEVTQLALDELRSGEYCLDGPGRVGR